ncbi:nucleoside hydrolase [Ruthenibacterium sp. CLA-JM-H11]|uniref:Nucleoside hydrolase n=1 Tax=Ruthenibacterium intestinale TaxID=3133163 RepID=A0ABV1GH92_9FIRM
MEKQKVILDVDTGTDDAVAIMLAALSPDVELLGVCSVNGNRGIDFTTENTLRVVEYLGLQDRIPVYRGCSLPMVSTLTPGRRDGIPATGEMDSNNIHGDYVELPPSTIHTQPEHAVFWLIDTLMKSDGDITLIPVGPLTNIAMALRIEPRIAQKIKQIVIMGGGYKEVNITPSAEFNFWVDPEAAKIVMDSGCDITVVPLDATHKAVLSLADADALESSGTPAGKATARFIRHRQAGYKVWQPMADIDTVPIHDALAVCAVIDPDVLQNVVHTYVDIDIAGGAADGMSICDVDKRYKDKQPNACVALSADKDRFSRMVKEILC